MVSEGYSIDDATAFCTKYKLTLKTTYVETNQYTPGKVISQSRIAGSEIIEGTTLTIEVAAKPTEKKENTTSSSDSSSSSSTGTSEKPSTEEKENS